MILRFAILILLLAASRVEATDTLTAQDAMKLVNDHVAARYAEHAVTVKVEQISKQESWHVGAYDSITVKYSRNRLPRGMAIFHLQLQNGRKMIRQLAISVRVRVFERVAVLREGLRSGQPVLDGMIEWRQMETTELRESPIKSIPETSIYARKTMKAGHVLVATDLEPPVAVKTGDAITLIYKKQALVLRLRATALGEGDVNDVIWLSTEISRKRLKGRILEPGLAALVH